MCKCLTVWDGDAVTYVLKKITQCMQQKERLLKHARVVSLTNVSNCYVLGYYHHERFNRLSDDY